jgi:hypothetical protein
MAYRKYYVYVPEGVAEGQSFNVEIESEGVNERIITQNWKLVINLNYFTSFPGNVISMVCPSGARAGARLEIQAYDATSQAYQRAVEMYRIPAFQAVYEPRYDNAYQRARQRSRSRVLYFWLLFDFVIFIFLVLSYSVPKFGTQYIGGGCNALNPNTNKKLSVLYYNLFRGIGSSPDCADSGDHFW